MTRAATIGLASAVAVHAAILFGFNPVLREARQQNRDEYFEVTLYEPPPPPQPPSIPPPAPPPVPIDRPAEPETEPPPEPLAKPPPVPEPEPEPKPPPAPAPKPDKPKPPREKPAAARPSPPAAPATSRMPSPAADRPPSSDSGGYQTVGNVSYLSHGRAAYPSESLRKRETGTVILLLYINESGTVDRVEVAKSSGVPALDSAAVAAEKRSRFRPAIRDGRPVKSKARVPYTFQLK